MNLGHFRLYDLVDTQFKKQLAGYYREGIEQCSRAGEKNPYGAGVPFIWCSNNLMVALATQCEAYEQMTGDARYSKFAVKQRDWLLGRNPWGVSMFTGIPEDGVSPRDVHLFGNAILKQMVRGGLVDGPVYRRVFQTLRGVTIREPDPFAAFQADIELSITTISAIIQLTNRRWMAQPRRFYCGRCRQEESNRSPMTNRSY